MWIIKDYSIEGLGKGFKCTTETKKCSNMAAFFVTQFKNKAEKHFSIFHRVAAWSWADPDRNRRLFTPTSSFWPTERPSRERDTSPPRCGIPSMCRHKITPAPGSFLHRQGNRERRGWRGPHGTQSRFTGGHALRLTV